MNSEVSLASLIVVLGFPPIVLYQINKHILFRSLDSLHFIFFQLVFFFAYHHLLGIPSLSTAIINYLSGKTLKSKNNTTKTVKFSGQKVNRKNKGDTTNSRQISSIHNSGAPKNGYSETTAKLLETMLEFVDTNNENSQWSLIYEDNETDVKVYKNSQVSDCCYKLTGTMENTPQTTFDLLADVKRRPEWDPMTDETGVVEVIDESTRIQYIKMKGVFPVSARDVVTIGYTTQLEDGRMVMVNRSIEHKLCPEKPGIVRLEAGCAGVVVVPIKDQPNKCFVTQIANANPKGWIPKSVIKLVSTRDMPASVKKLNRLLAKMPHQSVSKVLTRTPFIPKVSPRPLSLSNVSSTSSSTSSLQHNNHRKISSYGGKSSVKNGIESDTEEFLSNVNNNNKSISNKFTSANIPFWKSLVKIILFSRESGSKKDSYTKKIFIALAYSVVLIAGIKKWRNRSIL